MKLRNKKTGEIKAFDEVMREAYKWNNYNSLAELNSEWEDAPEEPKPWWYIDITLVVKQGELFLSKHVEQFKTVGNYFETREEAEKAVERLRAWKRLKDGGFVFCGKGDCLDTIKFDYGLAGYNNQDFNLLFGGEE